MAKSNCQTVLLDCFIHKLILCKKNVLLFKVRINFSINLAKYGQISDEIGVFIHSLYYLPLQPVGQSSRIQSEIQMF